MVEDPAKFLGPKRKSNLVSLSNLSPRVGLCWMYFYCPLFISIFCFRLRRVGRVLGALGKRGKLGAGNSRPPATECGVGLGV